MKLRFEPDLDFQVEAVDAVCDLFRGQEVCRTDFTIIRDSIFSPAGSKHAEAISVLGNQLTLSDDQIHRNLNEVQVRNGLQSSDSLDSGDFSIEMETGTGKTYVYLRTIFELNKRYGFTKFVVVVPSVAIKEGVYKMLQMTSTHFRALYANAPFEYFLYDSAKLGQVRNFATSQHVQIMIVTVGAINKKDVNNLYKTSEKTGGERPIDLIMSTHPILVVDEPQSVDGGLAGRGKEALKAMNSLCTLRYSATHFDEYHKVYCLDAIEAHERKLVKQIEVASATVEAAHNQPYVRLISTSRQGGRICAKVELDIETPGGKVRRVERTVFTGDDLQQFTHRNLYSNCRVGEMRVGKGQAFVELEVPGGELFLQVGETWGDVDDSQIQRQMIRQTIREHLDKEQRLHSLGIKVLSLFFVDAVKHYRSYDHAGNATKGKYARTFEEEYRRLSKHPNYRSLVKKLDIETDIERVHDGYFSIDKQGGWIDTAENNQINRDNAERAYNLIMKDKERLLNLDEPLRFIFSHSALREGWDNPNVFQICSLRDIRSERERRQTIGRGLRLCVNQDGDRVRGFEVNTLTIIAREGYEEFAENLQREIESDTGIRFGVIEPNQFARIPEVSDSGEVHALGLRKSRLLFEFLQTSGYIAEDGSIQDSLRREIRDGSFVIPDGFVAQSNGIFSMLRKHIGRMEVKDALERRTIRPRTTVLDGDEFKALWNRIKYKTTFRVNFDNKDLLTKCISALRQAPQIPKTRLSWRRADIAIGQSGVEATEISGSAVVALEETRIRLPDLLSELQDRTQLTRRSIYQIITKSKRLQDFSKNPQKFIELAAETINNCKNQVIVDGVKYRRIGDASYFAQELFRQEELVGYLKNMIAVEKSVYERVIYDSLTERSFADELEKNRDIKVYAKLPNWFTVPTPLGNYSPDWAILIDDDANERLYFVVETKGSRQTHSHRPVESAKIKCGKAHFEALKDGNQSIRYQVASSVNELLAEIK